MAGKSSFAKLYLFTLIIASGCALHRGVFGSNETPHTRTHSVDKTEKRLRNDIANFAEKQVGIKYKYGGKTPKGFDCSGYVTYVMQRFDIPVSGPSYSQEKLGRRIKKENAQPGDLVFFRKSKAGKTFHVSMVYANDGGDLTLIHSTSSRGVVIDKLSQSSYWRSKVMSIKNVIGE